MINIVNDPNTLLLLHGEDFVDSSGNERSITNKGVTVSTAQSKFGGSSFYFNGASYLTVPGYNFGANDFTIDWWEYATSSSAGSRFTSNFCTTYSTQAGGILLHCYESGLKVYASSATNNNWNLLSSKASGSNIINQWVHRAAVRSGNTLMLFVNGSLEYSYTLSGSIGYNSALPMGIGGWSVDGPGTGYFFTGYIDEFRISNVARWTANFTPPTEPYTDDAITVTAGGVIPQKYALRRRTLSNPAKYIPPTCVVTLTGTFTRSPGMQVSYYGVWVVIDGTIITTPGAYTVPYGSEIVLYAVRGTIYGSAHIYKDGTNIVGITGTSDRTFEVTYSHTVVGDCSISGSISSSDSTAIYRLDLTT